MLSNNLKLAAAGGSGQLPTYIDDLFSINHYVGNGNTGQNIVNGVDLSEGGLVITKNITTDVNGVIGSTGIGTNKYNSLAATSSTSSLTSFTSYNTNGYSIGGNAQRVNDSGDEYLSYSFKKHEGFCDIITYTGNGQNRTIAHNLGTTPGIQIIKRTDGTGNWVVKTSVQGNTKYLYLNNANKEATSSTMWNSTNNTSTAISIGTNSEVNSNGAEYVMYLFDGRGTDFGQDGDERVAATVFYQGNGTATKKLTINFEPQFVLIKRLTGGTGNWWIFDTIHGITYNTTSDDGYWRLDHTGSSIIDFIEINPDGFTLKSGSSSINNSSSLYFGYAIRRPDKPPSDGTDVFARAYRTAGQPQYVSGFPVDTYIMRNNLSTTNNDQKIGNRLSGGTINTSGSLSDGCVETITSPSVSNGGFWTFDNGIDNGTNSASTDNIAWMFKRAPKFHDVVRYTGTGTTNQDVTHNLGITPELVICKRWEGQSTDEQDWICWHKDLVNNTVLNNNLFQIILLNSFAGQTERSSSYTWDFSSTTFRPRHDELTNRTSANLTDVEYCAYLFGTAPGVSKVGSYTGTSSAQTIDCGFSNGARFVMLKRVNPKENSNTGGWYVFDDLRGIGSGNDPYIRLNDGSAQASYDLIGADSSGFTVPASNNTTNYAGYRYIFLAIA